MTRHLTRGDALEIAGVILPPAVSVRDAALLDAALARPRDTAFGEEAYPDPWLKAAALLRSVLIGHPLSDGNKRLAWTCAKTFLRLNGVAWGPVDQDAAYDLVIAVTTGALVDAAEIAARLRALPARVWGAAGEDAGAQDPGRGSG
ncbi:death on curing protein [Nocardiopsis flavescens]|uniref:Death on curing protein n=1 Tax=Nocardiopsis flavescens TaxID=758803 RepID=A0A1M6FWK4_9ACTN|nr:Fic family protein [Nocardiopsis flavescens]SHJ02088.1 death on curing protein [Nocardiopsis flavescens]